MPSGYMVCNNCGTTILRTRYPMTGDWNRRVSGVAVSGWGWQIETGSAIHLTFTPTGIVVQSALGNEPRSWAEITDMAVNGPGTQSRQGYGIFPIIDLADLQGSAINLGVQHLIKRASTTNTTRTLFSLVGPGWELVVYSDGVDTTALRWQLAPAFSAWREAKHHERLLIASGRGSELTGVVALPTSTDENISEVRHENM